MRSTAAGDATLSVSNLASVTDLKAEFISAVKSKAEVSQLRLFYSGKEMNNDFFLY